MKKGKILLFHWRGGYLTKEVLQELLSIFQKKQRQRGKQSFVSVNRAQAVLRVRFQEGAGEEQIEMEKPMKANYRKYRMTVCRIKIKSMKKTAEMEKGMRTGKKLTAEILSGKWDEALKKLYMDNQKIQQQKKRYVKAVASYCEIFGEMPVEIYSAPGRSEVGGNHTDHQHGRVLCGICKSGCHCSCRQGG